MDAIEFSPRLMDWLQRQHTPGTCLEISLIKAGCAGYEHQLRWIEVSTTSLNMDSNAPFPVTVPSGQEEKLQGLKLDLVQKSLNQEIQWQNPNANEACGCGISWTFPERSLPLLD